MNPDFNLTPDANQPILAIVGGGPAGLMAAETALNQGIRAQVFDSMGSVGRKFLLAGKGGLNLTHSEDFEPFVGRYREQSAWVREWLEDFNADALRAWARTYGVETFVGSSGRVFPSDLKAAPLLRSWVRRLRENGVRFHMHHRCIGWNEKNELCFETPEGLKTLSPQTTLFAMGGGSWAKLGSDGQWVPWIQNAGIDVHDLKPSNCGFEHTWSEHFKQRFAGAPIKPVVISSFDANNRQKSLQGEFVITETGIEGSVIYAVSADLRNAIEKNGVAELVCDLCPGRSIERLRKDLGSPRGKRSMTEHLRRHSGLEGVKIGLLYETLNKQDWQDIEKIIRAIKFCAITLTATRPMDEAISTAGGVTRDALNKNLMSTEKPGVFFAGEMLDWEAPTGGYLLTASMASGRLAGQSACDWLSQAIPATPI
ncbi:MAG: TIGR03862 family flavoprotein [Arenimonas sp.]